MGRGVRAGRVVMVGVLWLSAVATTAATSVVSSVVQAAPVDPAVPAVPADPAPVQPVRVAADQGLQAPVVASVRDVSFTVDLAQPADVALEIARRAGSVVSVIPTRSDTPEVPSVGLVEVHLRDEKVADAAGGGKVAFTVSPVDGLAAGQSVAVTINYSSFANAFGGVWSQRLTVLAAPECALTTPQSKECQERVPVAVTNDWRAHTLTFTVPVDPRSQPTKPANSSLLSRPASSSAAALLPGGGGTTYVLASSPAGGAGDFSATTLSTSASWNVGLGSGSFDWSYPVPMVPA